MLLGSHTFNTAQWRALQRQQLRESPLCAICMEAGAGGAATVVIHITPPGSDEDLFWSTDNLQSICKAHHDCLKPSSEHRSFSDDGAVGWTADPRQVANGGDGRLSKAAMDRRLPPDLRPSRIPCTIVCGPPGSGKSTYVRERITKTDTLIDLDAIMQETSRLPEHHTNRRYLRVALDERNRRLRALEHDTMHSAAWFIIAAPDHNDRAAWASGLGAQLIVLATPLAECIRRIEADPARVGQTARMIQAARDWWNVYEAATATPPVTPAPD